MISSLLKEPRDSSFGAHNFRTSTVVHTHLVFSKNPPRKGQYGHFGSGGSHCTAIGGVCAASALHALDPTDAIGCNIARSVMTRTANSLFKVSTHLPSMFSLAGYKERSTW